MKGICTVEGCGYTFTNPDKNQVKRVMGVHAAKKHGIPGTSPAARHSQKQNREALGNSQAEGPKLRKPKRAAMEANLCPVCGCNIRAVNAAINLGGRA